jgi:hypothetical protein
MSKDRHLTSGFLTSTRYYLEVPVTDTLADWPDERIWAELEERMAIPDQLPRGSR